MSENEPTSGFLCVCPSVLIQTGAPRLPRREPAHERDAPPYSVAVAQGASTSLPPSPPCSRPDVPHPAKCCGSIVSVPPARADRPPADDGPSRSASGSARLPLCRPTFGGSGGVPPPASIAIRSQFAIRCPSTTTTTIRHVPSQTKGAPAAAAGAGSARWWHLIFLCGVLRTDRWCTRKNPELGSFSLISFL